MPFNKLTRIDIEHVIHIFVRLIKMGKLGSLDPMRFHDEEAVAIISLSWMHMVIQRVMRRYAGEFMRSAEASYS